MPINMHMWARLAVGQTELLSPELLASDWPPHSLTFIGVLLCPSHFPLGSQSPVPLSYPVLPWWSSHHHPTELILSKHLLVFTTSKYSLQQRTLSCISRELFLQWQKRSKKHLSEFLDLSETSGLDRSESEESCGTMTFHFHHTSQGSLMIKKVEEIARIPIGVIKVVESAVLLCCVCLHSLIKHS